MKERKIILNVLPHMLIWGILFAFPFLFNPTDSPFSERTLIKNMIPLLLSAVLFYVNYFFLVEKYLLKDQILLFLLLNVALIAFCIYLMEASREFLPQAEEFKEFRKMAREHRNFPHPRRGGPNRGFMLFRTSLSFLLTSGVSVAIRTTQQWIKTREEKKTIENERLKSELAHLQYQLQPHFFFNALNNIYSLMDSAPAKAKESIHGLAKLMRYILYETGGDKIPLSKEIEFLQNCTKLMKLRLTDLVTLRVQFPENVGNPQIAPLLLIPLVENAFKHGVSTVLPTKVFINMRIEGQTLYFTTENTLLRKPQTDHVVSGIGLSNLEKRLALLYPERYEFTNEIVPDPEKTGGELYKANLIIQL